MADNPHGFNPVKHKLGVPLSATINPYYKAAAYGTGLFIGDAVVKAGSANTAVVFDGAETYGAGMLPDLNASGTGGPITGVMVGKSTRSGNLATVHSPADTEDVILVCDDPFVVFSAQEDSGGGNIAAASIGLNTEIVLGAGNATTGISGHEIDSSAVATTATLAVKILRLAPDHGNAIGANAEYWVTMNRHTEGDNIAGV